MAFKVVQLVELPGAPDYQEMFRQAGVDVELVKIPLVKPTEDDIIKAVGDADAVITGTIKFSFSRRVLSSLSNCKFVMSMGIGYDKLDVRAATDLGILAANVPDYCLDEMSDHTMALILACTRRVVQLTETVKRGDWKTEPDPYIRTELWPKLTRLRGRTLGLLGFGRVPRAVVPKARGFGLKIIACDPYVASEVFREFEVEQVDLERLLAKSDIVSVHVALTPETRHLLDLEQLQKMKPAACLVNTARGAIVDPEALHTVLSKGRMAAAALDVTEPEPIPHDSPLLKLDNFTVTAHCAHASAAAFAELMRRPGDEVIRVVRGEQPRGLLNPQVKEKYHQKWGLSLSG